MLECSLVFSIFSNVNVIEGFEVRDVERWFKVVWRWRWNLNLGLIFGY